MYSIRPPNRSLSLNIRMSLSLPIVLIRVTALLPALGQKMDSRTKSGSLWLIEV